MRLPNGYGSVFKLSGNRRKPWVARKTAGWDENKRQVFDVIGYYAKRDEALNALAEYNKNPYDINASKITFKEVYENWSAKKYEKIVDSNGYIAAYKLSSDLHNVKFADIRTSHMQDVVDTCGKAYPTLKNMKILYNQLYRYAMEHDIVGKNYSQFVDIGKAKKSDKHTPFTQNEIDKLWKNEEKVPHVDMVLIMIYSGLRPSELALLENDNIDLKNRTMIAGMKTEAGTNRLVPLSRKIAPLVEKLYNPDHQYLLVQENGKKVNYDLLRDWFLQVMNQLGMNHLPHDCRHTFGTLMSNAKANTASIQKIIGHASYVTTANIYTHKDVRELVAAVDLI